ncbi:hypothetical protein NHX12_030845 [Muraenolepis orangiensis]|uniref:Uncharacterized protein n=1 Tax=Muraenolepis orangiensis TaxID=630683 RepID=A0A9Q0IN94_9TELE|nr:hypothetical protein NHX12_030845 [Muraenolepis orangiensis]
MEKDFQSAPKHFWQTIRRLRRGKRGSIQAVYSKGGTLLTSTEEVIGQWKEHFEELLNPSTPSMVETELEEEGRQTSISLEEVTTDAAVFVGQKARATDRAAVRPLKASQMDPLVNALTHPAGTMVPASVIREPHDTSASERNLVASFSFSSMYSSSMPTYISPCLSTLLLPLTL